MHGDWLVVSRRKRANVTQKEQLKNSLGAQLSNKFEKIPQNVSIVGHVGFKEKGQAFNAQEAISQFAPTSDSKSAKSNWKLKKRRHDDGSTHQPPTPTTTKVNLTSAHKPLAQKKEINKEVKELAPTLKTKADTRRPLQESSKQNIAPLPSETTTPLKGYKTAMQIEQVSNIQFRFTEENKPPDTVAEIVDLMEEVNEDEGNNMVVLMQEDKDTSGKQPPSQPQAG